MKWIRRVVIGIVLFSSLLAGAWFYLLQPNIHTVLPGEVYRSATLSPQRFHALLVDHHIQSVVNLRGKNAQSAWYRQEVATTKTLGVSFYSIALSAHIRPTPLQLRTLVQILAQAKRPMLVHCRGGSDRTGLAAALVLLLDNQSVAQAWRAISWRYYVFRDSSVGNQVLASYQAWLIAQHKTSSRAVFLQWVNQ